MKVDNDECIAVMNKDRPVGITTANNDILHAAGYGVWEGTYDEDRNQVPTEVDIEIKREGLAPEPNSQCFCKTVVYRTSPQHVRFFCQTDMHGDLVNPWGASSSEGRAIRYTKSTGKPAYKMKEVNRVVFEKYLKFLCGRNQLHFRAADREMKNG